MEAALFGLARGQEHIGRVSAGADGKQDIASLPESLNLPGKYVLVAIVVGDGGEQRGISSEGHGGQGGSFLPEAADELCRQVLRIGCTASVATEEHAVTILQGSGGTFTERAQARQEFGRELLLYLTTLGDLPSCSLNKAQVEVPRLGGAGQHLLP